MVARQIDMLKARGITTLATALGHGEETSTVSVSSLVDTWLLLRNVETNGERNRLLFVLKSRGSAHSNQVREFVLTDHGIELIDVYVGAAGMLAGSARLAQQAAERDAECGRPTSWTAGGGSCPQQSPSARPTSQRCRTSSPPSGRSSTRSTWASTGRPPRPRRTGGDGDAALGRCGPERRRGPMSQPHAADDAPRPPPSR